MGPKAVRLEIDRRSCFIRPGYEFKIVDGNVHKLPSAKRTTMLVMLSAMIGRNNLLQAYGHAVENGILFEFWRLDARTL